MGNAVGIVSQLGLSVLWKYVFNSMERHSNCCKDVIVCDCITKEVEVESDDGNCGVCCGEGYDSTEHTSTSNGGDIFSREDV